MSKQYQKQKIKWKEQGKKEAYEEVLDIMQKEHISWEGLIKFLKEKLK